MPSKRHPLALVAMLLLSTGCQSYAPLPLDQQPHLATRLADLTVDRVALGERGGAIDPTRPLTATALALLAVENNLDLRAARARRGVSRAQVLQAGLLPNPQLSGSLGFVLGGPGTATAWTAALGEDIKALVTLSAGSEAAAAEARKVDADLLWQEWHVIGKARLLFVDTVEQTRLQRLLAQERRLFADRYRRSKRAVDEGNLPLSAAVPDLTALADVDKLIADLERAAATRQHDLDALLGLSPDVTLMLATDIDVSPLDPGTIEHLLPQLPARRPDLVALQLGYTAQEAKLRGAILAQFPALIIGGTGGSDTTAVTSAGPQVTIDLPIFNRNQGNIAIERATRAQLHAEYSARLSEAVGELRGLLAEQTLLERQLAEAKARLPELEAAAGRADAAYRAGNLDERGYVDLAAGVIGQRQTIIAKEQALLEQRVAMATLMGAGMPVVARAALSTTAEVHR